MFLVGTDDSVVSVDVIESNVKLLLTIYECRSLLKLKYEITVLVMNFQLPNLTHEKSRPNLICNLIKLLWLYPHINAA